MPPLVMMRFPAPLPGLYHCAWVFFHVLLCIHTRLSPCVYASSVMVPAYGKLAGRSSASRKPPPEPWVASLLSTAAGTISSTSSSSMMQIGEEVTKGAAAASKPTAGAGHSKTKASARTGLHAGPGGKKPASGKQQAAGGADDAGYVDVDSKPIFDAGGNVNPVYAEMIANELFASEAVDSTESQQLIEYLNRANAALKPNHPESEELPLAKATGLHLLSPEFYTDFLASDDAKKDLGNDIPAVVERKLKEGSYLEPVVKLGPAFDENHAPNVLAWRPRNKTDFARLNDLIKGGQVYGGDPARLHNCVTYCLTDFRVLSNPSSLPAVQAWQAANSGPNLNPNNSPKLFDHGGHNGTGGPGGGPSSPRQQSQNMFWALAPMSDAGVLTIAVRTDPFQFGQTEAVDRKPWKSLLLPSMELQRQLAWTIANDPDNAPPAFQCFRFDKYTRECGKAGREALGLSGKADEGQACGEERIDARFAPYHEFFPVVSADAFRHAIGKALHASAPKGDEAVQAALTNDGTAGRLKFQDIVAALKSSAKDATLEMQGITPDWQRDLENMRLAKEEEKLEEQEEKAGRGRRGHHAGDGSRRDVERGRDQRGDDNRDFNKLSQAVDDLLDDGFMKDLSEQGAVALAAKKKLADEADLGAPAKEGPAEKKGVAKAEAKATVAPRPPRHKQHTKGGRKPAKPEPEDKKSQQKTVPTPAPPTEQDLPPKKNHDVVNPAARGWGGDEAWTAPAIGKHAFNPVSRGWEGAPPEAKSKEGVDPFLGGDEKPPSSAEHDVNDDVLRKMELFVRGVNNMGGADAEKNPVPSEQDESASAPRTGDDVDAGGGHDDGAPPAGPPARGAAPSKESRQKRKARPTAKKRDEWGERARREGVREEWREYENYGGWTAKQWQDWYDSDDGDYSTSEEVDAGHRTKVVSSVGRAEEGRTPEEEGDVVGGGPPITSRVGEGVSTTPSKLYDEFGNPVIAPGGRRAGKKRRRNVRRKHRPRDFYDEYEENERDFAAPVWPGYTAHQGEPTLYDAEGREVSLEDKRAEDDRTRRRQELERVDKTRTFELGSEEERETKAKERGRVRRKEREQKAPPTLGKWTPSVEPGGPRQPNEPSVSADRAAEQEVKRTEDIIARAGAANKQRDEILSDGSTVSSPRPAEEAVVPMSKQTLAPKPAMDEKEPPAESASPKSSPKQQPSPKEIMPAAKPEEHEEHLHPRAAGGEFSPADTVGHAPAERTALPLVDSVVQRLLDRTLMTLFGMMLCFLLVLFFLVMWSDRNKPPFLDVQDVDPAAQVQNGFRFYGGGNPYFGPPQGGQQGAAYLMPPKAKQRPIGAKLQLDQAFGEEQMGLADRVVRAMGNPQQDRGSVIGGSRETGDDDL